MPNHWLGPTLEEVQVWLRSAPDWVQAGFVLNVEAVNARLGRVLVVEDDPGIATQLVRGLTRAGYETGSVTTGKAALDWPVPDVVLLDAVHVGQAEIEQRVARRPIACWRWTRAPTTT
jgi:hypothetical protein